MNKVKRFSILFAVLLCLGVLFSVLLRPTNYTATAEIKENDTDIYNTATSLSDTNYRYTAPKPANFIIETVAGAACLKEEEIVLSFNNAEIVIPNFDFYRLLDAQNKLMFYQADVAKAPSSNESYAYLAAMPNINGKYELIVQYGVKQDLTLYEIKALLNEELLGFIDAKSNDLHIGEDEISQRLKASSKVHMLGEYKESENGQTHENEVSTLALNTIDGNSYDGYTNSIEYVYNYWTRKTLTRTLTADEKITDDYIVRIIPKELWSIVGEHFYIGKQYGFFIKVIERMGSGFSYEADILVFQILNKAPSFPSNVTGSCKISPLFNWRYDVADKNYNDWYNFDPSLSVVVTPSLNYDQAELFLDDVGIKISLENPDALNFGDTGYKALEDDGAFIIQTRANAKGVGLKKKGGSFLADTASFAFGFIPYVSSALSTYSYVYNVYNGFGNGGYLYTRNTTFSDNEANIDTYETNSTDQINQRGYLIKSKATTIKSDPNSPRLINVGGYAEVKYVVARRNNSNYNKMRVITSASANVLEDNTSRWWLFGWHENGEVNNYGRATGTYVTKSE